MLLNLIRVEEADPQYMISRSFHQFQYVTAWCFQNTLDAHSQHGFCMHVGLDWFARTERNARPPK